MEAIEGIEKLDARWYGRFEALAFEDYDKLSGDKEIRAQEKEKFLTGKVLNPQLDYPKVETFDFDYRENGLLELKQDILEREGNEAVKKIYRTKINESLALLRMLRATKESDDRKFSRYADFVYGKPAETDTAYVVESIREQTAKVVGESENEQQVAVAKKLLAFLSQLPEQEISGVTKEVLSEGMDISGHLADAEEAKRLFEIALSELNAEDWSVVIDTETGLKNFRVSQETKQVTVPEDGVLQSRNLSLKKFRGLIEHEIKTHVARRVNGERSKLQLLGLGLDRYIEAEEGIATYNEQQVTGAKEFAGIPRYFSVALAKGLGGEPRDFRQTFELMKQYRMVTAVGKNITEDKAAELAYNDCVRIFRGTTGMTPGAIYPKDKAYYNNRAIWQLVENDTDAVHSFSIGKYDPNNQEHITLLTQLGILDQDLERLEE